MTDDLRARIAEAIRRAAYDCLGDDCPLSEEECLAQHPIEAAGSRFDRVSRVYADVGALAEIAASVVRPELDRLTAERDAQEQQAEAEALNGVVIFSAYYGRWQGTIAEARRQAARAERAEAEATRLRSVIADMSVPAAEQHEQQVREYVARAQADVYEHVPCGFGFDGHDPHAWTAQPGMQPVWCPGSSTSPTPEE